MNQDYYDTVTQLEKKNVDPGYILGWQGGYLRNPPLEEQRVSEAYSAGYEDGMKHETTHSAEWIKK